MNGTSNPAIPSGSTDRATSCTTVQPSSMCRASTDRLSPSPIDQTTCWTSASFGASQPGAPLTVISRDRSPIGRSASAARVSVIAPAFSSNSLGSLWCHSRAWNVSAPIDTIRKTSTMSSGRYVGR